MKPVTLARSLLMTIVLLVVASSQEPKTYPPGPDSAPQEGVPKGEVLQFSFSKSSIFPGTYRDYWVYVPAQYSPDRPACLYVNQDGIQYQAPVVFDNLIHRKEMPVTIGLFVMHGRVIAADENTAQDRFNRSFEYDSTNDNYVRFLIEELLPEVETKKTSDGRAIRISKDPNDRAIGGASSGAICAFTAAWERPDAFRRVFSAIGTYVGLRNGDRYHTLIRKFEPKPIRIFLQDGSNDLNIYGGDWWMANQTIERALVFSGYEVTHVWGEGPHNGNHATAVFPDAMRWLWKDWPKPVGTGQSRNNTLRELLIPGEGWQLASEGHRSTEGPSTNSKGEVFFTDSPNNKSYRIGLDGKVTEFLADTGRAGGQTFGADGRLYVANIAAEKIVAYDPSGAATVITEGLRGNDLAVANNGNIYVTQPAPLPGRDNRVWLVKPNGEKSVVDTGINYPNGITLSPDQKLLYVAEYRSHWVWSFQIQPDGTLLHKQRFFWLHAPDTADDSGTDGIKVDRDGRLYVATRLGVQICDQPGRVQAIIPTPNGRISNLTLGGEKFDTLFATCGDKVYKRRLNVRGAQAWDTPNKPPRPRL